MTRRRMQRWRRAHNKIRRTHGMRRGAKWEDSLTLGGEVHTRRPSAAITSGSAGAFWLAALLRRAHDHRMLPAPPSPRPNGRRGGQSTELRYALAYGAAPARRAP